MRIGTVNSDVIAPGTFGKIDIKVDTTGTQVHLQYDLDIDIENCPTNLRFYSDEQFNEMLDTTRSGTGTSQDPKRAIIDITKYVDKNSHGLHDETIYWKWDFETTPGEAISDADLVDSEDIGKVTTASIHVKGFEILEMPDEDVPGEKYTHPEEVVFTGNNYLNTNIYLFSEENIHRNFIISFDIDNVDSSNINHNALMNSMDESGTPWPGCVVKYSVTTNTRSVKFESNSISNSSGDVFIDDTVKNVRIIRINDILYYSFNGEKCIKINTYLNDNEKTFNVPVTFGASMDGTGNPYRYFKGTLSNMSVKFISNDAVIEDFNPARKPMEVVYTHTEPYVFNGTSDYIDTGLKMFTAENIDKNFEVSFNIDSIGSGNVNQAVLLNGKDEGRNTYPGFVYRIYTDGTIRFDSKGGTGTGASNRQTEVQHVRIYRNNKKMYLCINGGEEKEVYNYTNFTEYHNVPLTIGTALKNGNPMRYFKGTLSNIVVKAEP